MTDATLDSLARESAARLAAAMASKAKAKAPDLRQCHQYALFFAPLRNHGWILFFMFLLLAAFSGLMTQCTRAQTPKPPAEKGAAAATATSTSATATAVDGQGGTGVEGEPTSIPAQMDVEGGLLGVDMAVAEGEEPPPYQPSPSTPTAADAVAALHANPNLAATVAATPKSKPIPRASAAHRFVTGTASIIASLLSLFFLALTIQTILFCVWGPLNDTPTSVFYWFVFCIPAVFACFGVGSWAILFRDLFGKRVKERWPFGEEVVMTGLAMVVFVPFALLGMAGMWGGKWVVKGVESCQRWCCSDALEDEEQLEDEVPLELERRAEDAIEDGEGEGSGSGSGSGNANGEQDEERVGLIGGAKK